MIIIASIISFFAGCLVTAAMIRYGMGLSAKLIERTKEGLPVFSKDDDMPVSQTHTSGIEEIEEQENYEDENER